MHNSQCVIVGKSIGEIEFLSLALTCSRKMKGQGRSALCNPHFYSNLNMKPTAK